MRKLTKKELEHANNECRYKVDVRTKLGKKQNCFMFKSWRSCYQCPLIKKLGEIPK